MESECWTRQEREKNQRLCKIRDRESMRGVVRFGWVAVVRGDTQLAYDAIRDHQRNPTNHEFHPFK